MSERPKLEETVDILVHMVDKLDLGQQEMLTEMRAGFRQLHGEIGGVKGDVSDLKTDVADLKTDVSGLKTDVADLKTDVADLKTDVRRLEAKLDDVAETLTEVVSDHETRITALEGAKG